MTIRAFTMPALSITRMLRAFSLFMEQPCGIPTFPRHRRHQYVTLAPHIGEIHTSHCWGDRWCAHGWALGGKCPDGCDAGLRRSRGRGSARGSGRGRPQRASRPAYRPRQIQRGGRHRGEALALAERVLGQEHPDTLPSVNDLASSIRPRAVWRGGAAFEARARGPERVLGGIPIR